MFTHPYVAEMLAAQRTRELRADAHRARLARQLRIKPPRAQRSWLRRAHRQWNLWTTSQRRRRTATKPT